jgi:hypothetical protein
MGSRNKKIKRVKKIYVLLLNLSEKSIPTIYLITI